MPDPGPRLLLTDGGVSGLLACAVTAALPAASLSVVVWDASSPGAGIAHQEAANRQAEVFGLRFQGPAVSAKGDQRIPSPTTVVLLEAAQLALAAGCTSLVWPISAGPGRRDGGPDPAVLAATFERAELVTRLVRLDLPGDAGFSIETPYADLTDRQLADLVLDMDLPIWLCWWADSDRGEAASERAHWTEMLNAAGWRGELPTAALKPEVVIPPHRTAVKPR